MARDLPLLLEILADELKNPAFSAAELGKARKELENDYLRADDETSQRAQQRLSQLAFAEGHPYHSQSGAAKLKSLAAITADELRAFHRARYGGAGRRVSSTFCPLCFFHIEAQICAA